MPQGHLERSRAELSDFLTSRRARLSPGDVGLPDGGRRRTQGLRREEVAALAGVGLTWYTWFEQGRDIRVSPDFLENVARALRLNGAERRHLFVLLDREMAPVAAVPERKVSPAQQRMIDGMPHYPAYYRTARWDVIAWNRPANRLFGFGTAKPEERNLMRMMFLDEAFRGMVPNWAQAAPNLLAKFRGDYARYRGDAATEALIKELQQRSPEFKLWWRRHDVLSPGEGIKTLRLPGKGDMLFEHTSFSVNGEPDLNLVVYAPLGPAKPRSGRKQ